MVSSTGKNFPVEVVSLKIDSSLGLSRSRKCMEDSKILLGTHSYDELEALVVLNYVEGIIRDLEASQIARLKIGVGSISKGEPVVIIGVRTFDELLRVSVYSGLDEISDAIEILTKVSQSIASEVNLRVVSLFDLKTFH